MNSKLTCIVNDTVEKVFSNKIDLQDLTLIKNYILRNWIRIINKDEDTHENFKDFVETFEALKFYLENSGTKCLKLLRQ